jgi:L-alanine-DL-glutamate epimerase-like enolase superfamily enzyme
MKILAIRDTVVPIGSRMANAAIAFDSMTASAVAIVTDRHVDGKPVIGYAFDSIGRYAKGGLLRERFIPRLLAAPPTSLLDAAGLIDPELCRRAMMTNEKEGGHGERSGAVGLLDCALWDARAKAEGKPLWRVLRERFGRGHGGDTIDVYGSCGHLRPGNELVSLRDEVRRACEAGFMRVKIKLAGTSVAADCARIEAAASVLGEASALAVDLNGCLEPDIAGDWFRRTSAYRLAWVEEPAPPLDYSLLASFVQLCERPIATGENLFSWDDARNLLRYGGLRADRDLLQFDVSFSYGVTGLLRILGGYEAACWSRQRFMPHAGHLLAAQVVAGLGLAAHEAAADASLPYGGFWDGTPVVAGRVRLPDLPGVGFEGKANLHALLRPLSESP